MILSKKNKNNVGSAVTRQQMMISEAEDGDTLIHNDLKGEPVTLLLKL